MKDKIEYICEKIKGTYYSDNKIDYVKNTLISLNNENLVNRYLLDLSILVIKAYSFSSPITDDSNLVNEWDKEYDELCDQIINTNKINNNDNYTRISKKDLENLLANPLWKSSDSSIVGSKNLSDTLNINSLINKTRKNE